MRKPIKIAVVKILSLRPSMFNVYANGKLVGVVERATISLSGGPEWVAHYLRRDESRATHGIVFSGEFGNVEAVSCILQNTGVAY